MSLLDSVQYISTQLDVQKVNLHRVEFGISVSKRWYSSGSQAYPGDANESWRNSECYPDYYALVPPESKFLIFMIDYQGESTVCVLSNATLYLFRNDRGGCCWLFGSSDRHSVYHD